VIGVKPLHPWLDNWGPSHNNWQSYFQISLTQNTAIHQKNEIYYLRRLNEMHYSIHLVASWPTGLLVLWGLLRPYLHHSNLITLLLSCGIMQQCLGTRNQCKVVPICIRQNAIIWTISLYMYKLVATVGKHTWQETLTKHLLAGDQASKILIFTQQIFCTFLRTLKAI